MDTAVTFNSLLGNLETFNVGAGFSTGNIIMSLCYSLLISLFIGVVYRYTYQGVLFSKSFNVSLVIISLITSVIIMTISGNLILSLGMVGALSIVRFRTAVKDPIDLAYMFWAITIGIANGVGFYKLSIIGSLFVALVLIVSLKQRKFQTPYLGVIKLDKDDVDAVRQSVKHTVGKYQLRSLQYLGDEVEMIVEFRATTSKNIGLIDKLGKAKGVKSLHVVTYSGDVETVQ